MAEVCYALSLKQPWATLLVHGLKTIEIRRWPTRRRGRVLIHAARVPDPQPWAWEQLPPHLRAARPAGRRHRRRRRADGLSHVSQRRHVRRRPGEAPQRSGLVSTAGAVRLQLHELDAAGVSELSGLGAILPGGRRDVVIVEHVVCRLRLSNRC